MGTATSLLVILMLQSAGGVDIGGGGPTDGRGEDSGQVISDPAETLVAANAAYGEGRYREAIQSYGSLLGDDSSHPWLHYNLGNALLRSGELGLAISSYRRASVGLPRNQDVRANLEFARDSTRDALTPPAPSPVLRTLFFWHFGLSPHELRWLTAGLYGALWFLLGARLYRRRSETLRWATALVLLALLCAAGSEIVRLAAPEQVAVVIPQEIEAYSGTQADALLRFKLHAGSELRVLATADGWIRISLPDGQQGWIEAAHVEMVNL